MPRQAGSCRLSQTLGITKGTKVIDTLDRKIRQMHAALSDTKSDDISSIQVQRHETATGFYCSINLNGGTDDAQLANVASLLVANIACIKDHLKVWCQKQGVSFEGENLINSSQPVALIHDLWNIDKHAELNRPPRSGHKPKLVGLRRVLSVSSGPQANSGGFFVFNMNTGKAISGASNGGAVQLALTAEIVDENNVKVDEFITVCKQATAAWEQELRRAGVPVP